MCLVCLQSYKQYASRYPLNLVNLKCWLLAMLPHVFVSFKKSPLLLTFVLFSVQNIVCVFLGICRGTRAMRGFWLNAFQI